MPYSAGENAEFVGTFLKGLGPETIIDIGPGAGFYADIARKNTDAHLTGIEVFDPYVKMFNLNDKYDRVITADVRDVGGFKADVVIAGDILEHLSELDMTIVVERMLEDCKYLIISVPIVHYPQDHSHDNEFEKHLQEDLNKDELVRLFGEPYLYKEYGVTGTFIYKGKNA